MKKYRFKPEKLVRNLIVLAVFGVLSLIFLNDQVATDSQGLTTSFSELEIQNLEFYPVAKVVDGDTIKVDRGEEVVSVRLIGVDTPESVHPKKPVECFGKEASTYVKALIEGKQVALEHDPTQGDRDKYNRRLRYVILENGEILNEKLILDGYAFEYTYQVPYLYQQQFKNAQQIAQNDQRGLWAGCEY